METVVNTLMDTINKSIATSVPDTLYISNIAAGDSQFAKFIELFSPLLGPLLGTIIGGIIVLYTQYRLARHKEKNEVNLWFEEEYIVTGIDLIIANLNKLIYSYYFLLKYWDDEEVKAKEKVSHLLKEKTFLELINALSKLQLLFSEDLLYERSIGVLNDKLCDKLEKKQVESRLPFTIDFKNHLVKIKKILVGMNLSTKHDIYDLCNNLEIQNFVTEESDFFDKMKNFVYELK